MASLAFNTGWRWAYQRMVWGEWDEDELIALTENHPLPDYAAGVRAGIDAFHEELQNIVNLARGEGNGKDE
jgi:hypothetical protein